MVDNQVVFSSTDISALLLPKIKVIQMIQWWHTLSAGVGIGIRIEKLDLFCM